jgi:threonine dehydrogenase-like Zn-dependent dehydrogenase
VDACEVAATGAEVVLVGTPWARTTEVYAQQILKAVFYRLLTLRSGWEYEIPLRRMPFSHGGHNLDYSNARHTVFSGYEKALAWLAAGRIPLAGLVRTVSPRDAAAVYRSLQRRDAEELFLVWDWTAL